MPLELPAPTAPDGVGPRFALHAEDELTDADHGVLAALLRRVYPDDARLFAGDRSWAGARPQHRVLGRRDGLVVAHLGLVVRAVRPGSPPVADVGLVGVDPPARGGGTGRALLDAAAAAIDHLALPFGFLTCDEGVVDFYRRAGWRRLPAVPVRMTSVHGESGEHRGPALVLPVRAPRAAWPEGPLDRDGTEV